MRSSKLFANLTLLVVAGLALTQPLAAVSTDTAVQVTYDHFEDGKLENISIPADGGLRLAPAIEKIAKLDAAVIWKAVADADGNMYVGTGNDGKVFKVTPDGTVTTLFTPGESLARALALDAKGNLYVGTSPDGYVYRIAPGGRPEIYFHSDETYIWDLKFDAKGNLYVATGAKGRVYRLPPDYQTTQTPEVYFETDRTHITTLAFDSAGALLAGAGPKSVLYRITAKDKATVLASPGGDEINGIVAQSDGTVYFSTFNKSSAPSSASGHSGASAPSGSTPPPPPGGGGSGGPPPSSPPSDDDGSDDDAGGPPGSDSGGGPPSPSPSSGPKYSQLYRVNPSGFVEPVWSLAHTGV
jgi:sugar lactone lactonase YvrE